MVVKFSLPATATVEEVCEAFNVARRFKVENAAATACLVWESKRADGSSYRDNRVIYPDMSWREFCSLDPRLKNAVDMKFLAEKIKKEMRDNPPRLMRFDGNQSTIVQLDERYKFLAECGQIAERMVCSGNQTTDAHSFLKELFAYARFEIKRCQPSSFEDPELSFDASSV